MYKRQVQIVRADGQPLSAEDWADPEARSIAFVLRHEGADSFLLLFNAADNGVHVTLPAPDGEPWELALSSDPALTVAADEPNVIAVSYTHLRAHETQWRISYYVF